MEGKVLQKVKHLIFGCLVFMLCLGMGNEIANAKGLKTTSLSTKSVKVYWEPVKGATSYDVYKKEQKAKKYKLIKTIKKCDIKISVEKNRKYSFKVIAKIPVPSESEQEENTEEETEDENKDEGEQEEEPTKYKKKEMTCSFDNASFASMNHQKYTYAEMEKDISQLCKKYSEYVQYDIIGKSGKGKKIYDVILGNRNAKKSLLIISELHAREYVTTVICMKQLEYYLENYNKKIDGKIPGNVFKKCNVHYVMMANPDGVEISQKKNARWKGNKNGVNLNRNFPYKFKVRGKNTVDYTGKKAASEKETQAIISIAKKLKKSQKTLGVISYHAMGQIIFGSYRGNDKKLKSQIRKMYNVARKTTGYADAGSYDNDDSNGCSREYFIYNQKIPFITIEVGSVATPIPQKYYGSIFNKNKLVMLRVAQIL